MGDTMETEDNMTMESEQQPNVSLSVIPNERDEELCQSHPPPMSRKKVIEPISSHEIDSSFVRNIKQARIQQDFMKSIDFEQNSKYFYGLSEKMCLKIFSFDADRSIIREVFSKQYPQPLYDSVMFQNKSSQDIIALSIKNQPIYLYRLKVEDSRSSSDNSVGLKCIGYLTSQKKNTEVYQTPLQFKKNIVNEFVTRLSFLKKSTLFGCGKQFLIQYDIARCAVKDTYERFSKSDILSCFDIPKQDAQDYSKYSNTIVYGKFDKKIDIFDFSSKKIIHSFGMHLGGITCLKFDPLNSNYLYSGARKDDLIYQWVIYSSFRVLTYRSKQRSGLEKRRCTTNQRMNFDINNNQIVFGHQNGSISIANTQTQEIMTTASVHNDCVNSVKLFDYSDKKYLLSCSGQRHYQLDESESDESDECSCSSDDEIDIKNKMELENTSALQQTNSTTTKTPQQQPTKYTRQDNSIKISLI